MAENVYECLYILDANAYARDPGGAASTIDKLVDGLGGHMLASRLWNEQKLAYPIKGRHKGAYWLSYFRMETDKVAQFNRACRLSDLVLRHMAIKIDPRLVEALVMAAKGVAPATEVVEESETTTDEAESGKEPVTTGAAEA